jgi:hypothetical protein
MQQNGVQFGTFAFSASGTTATFSVSSDTQFNAGDVLTVVAPGSADATLGNIACTINVQITG